MSVDIQLVGSGLIKFDFLIQRLGTREAARDAFEDLVEDIIELGHRDVRSIEANPGDWGIDAFVGQLTKGGEVFIWQSKYYIDGFGKTQQRDVNKSYKSALTAAATHGYTVKGWTLCIPVTLDGPNTQWWQGWAKRQKDGVEIDLWDEGKLRRSLLRTAATDIRNHYFAPAFTIGEPEEEPQQPRHLSPLNDESNYREALFVRQMEAARLVETFEAKEAFFNAEILMHEVLDKGIPAEEAALTNWRMRTSAAWSKHFNDAAQQHDEDLLPGLFKAVMTDIETHHATEPPTLRASPVHGFGLMHQSVESGRAGWVRSWRDIAAEHDPRGSTTQPMPEQAELSSHVASSELADDDE